MNSISIKKHFAFLLFFAFVLVGCAGGGDDIIETSESSSASLSNFSFKKADNANMSTSSTGVTNGNLIYITVPEDINLKSIVPSFSIPKGATATINGQPVESSYTPCDFSSTTKIVVTSQNGKAAKSYTILAKNGDPVIDGLVYSFMLKHDVPGVSVAISKDEETVYKGGYGFAVVDSEQRVTPQTLFRLASMSKQQTTLAIMHLYEAGLLDINANVFGKGGILEQQFGTNVQANVDKVTVKHLLQHTGGWASDPIYISASTTLDQRIADMVQNKALKYAPGSTYDYSNFGFCVLGKIIEVVSGKDYETYLKETVHKKAGISNIFVGKNDLLERRSNECQYYGQGGKNAYGNNVELSKAAGGMIASTEELMKLMAYIDYGTKVPDIFKKETLDMMYTPLEGVVNTSGSSYNKYAMGWRTEYPNYPDWATFHGGTLAGVATIWARSNDNVNGVVLCNSRSYDTSSDMDADMWHMLEDIQAMF